MDKKKCTKCGDIKHVSCFRLRKGKSGKDSYRNSVCIDCERKFGREYRAKNIEKFRVQVAEWKKNNPQKVKEHSKKAEAKRMQKGRNYHAEYERTKLLGLAKKPSHDPKTCTKCGETKPANEFIFQKVFGRRHCQCNDCRKEYSRERLEKIKDENCNKEKRKEYWIVRGKELHKQYIELNREKIRRLNRASYRKHKEKRIAQAKTWAINNRERINANMRLRRNQLTDSVVRGIIFSQTGLKAHEIPSDLVETKRAQLQIHRDIRQLIQAIKEKKK